VPNPRVKFCFGKVRTLKQKNKTKKNKQTGTRQAAEEKNLHFSAHDRSRRVLVLIFFSIVRNLTVPVRSTEAFHKIDTRTTNPGVNVTPSTRG
jgi:hypothetical protein